MACHDIPWTNIVRIMGVSGCLDWISGFGLNRQASEFYGNLRLHYNYETMRCKLISVFNPLMSDSVRRYSELQRRISPSIQLTTMENKDVFKEDNIQNINYLKNALEFLQYSCEGSKSIQPILFHYSWQFFVAFFTNSLFQWASAPTGHGIHTTKLDALPDLRISFDGGGSFGKLVDCLTVLGIPTFRSLWLPIPENKSLRFEANDLHNRLPCKKKVCLPELLDFDVDAFCREVEAKYQSSGYATNMEVRYINEEVLGYIIVFVASNIARYRPALWHKVIEGTDELATKMNHSVMDSYSHCIRGAPSSSPNIPVDEEHSFINAVKRILGWAQNHHYLKEHFDGSFVLTNIDRRLKS